MILGILVRRNSVPVPGLGEKKVSSNQGTIHHLCSFGNRLKDIATLDKRLEWINAENQEDEDGSACSRTRAPSGRADIQDIES
jgi:hypothetical protein